MNNTTQFITHSNISNPILNVNQGLSGFNGQIMGTTNNNNNNNNNNEYDDDDNDNHNDKQRGEKL